MVISIILYFVLSCIIGCIVTKYQKKYPNKSIKIFCIFLVALLLIGFFVMIVPIVIGNNILTENCVKVHSYENIGTLYYDRYIDEYFIAYCNNWSIINMWSRIVVDYDLGQSVHIAENLISSSEEPISIIVKGG